MSSGKNNELFIAFRSGKNFQESLSTQGRRKLEDYVKYSSGTSGSALPTDHSPQVWIFLLVILP